MDATDWFDDDGDNRDEEEEEQRWQHRREEAAYEAELAERMRADLDPPEAGPETEGADEELPDTEGPSLEATRPLPPIQERLRQAFAGVEGVHLLRVPRRIDHLGRGGR